MHFASTGVLLLRNLEFRRAYVSGCCMMLESLLILRRWRKAMNVPKADSDSHAWVEVYLDDYGWVPVEMTLPQKNLHSDKEK